MHMSAPIGPRPTTAPQRSPKKKPRLTRMPLRNLLSRERPRDPERPVQPQSVLQTEDKEEGNEVVGEVVEWRT